MNFYIFHRHRVCLVDHVNLIFSLYSWWEDLRSSLATLPLGFNCDFISTSACGSSTGVWLLKLPWRAWICPCEGQLSGWCSCLGCRGSGSTKYSGGLVARLFCPMPESLSGKREGFQDSAIHKRGSLFLTQVRAFCRNQRSGAGSEKTLSRGCYPNL